MATRFVGVESTLPRLPQGVITASQGTTAADLAPGDVALGIMAYAQVTANQASITAVVDLTGLSVTWTAIAGRSYKITGSVLFFSSVANDVAGLVIADGANTQVQAGSAIVPVTNGVLVQRHVRLAALSGSVTYKLRGIRTAGTGNITMSATATAPASILVEDMGIL